MKQALLLIDLQNDYFPGGKMELVESEKAVENSALLLDKFRKDSLDIIHLQHIAIGEGSGFFLPDTEGAEFHNKVTPINGEKVLTKHFPNGFRQTDLQRTIEEKGVDHLVICGAMSHMCIDATVRAAFDFGLQCTVVEDGCATKDLQFGNMVIGAADVHGSFMAALSAVYADIVQVSTFI